MAVIVGAFVLWITMRGRLDAYRALMGQQSVDPDIAKPE